MIFSAGVIGKRHRPEMAPSTSREEGGGGRYPGRRGVLLKRQGGNQGGEGETWASSVHFSGEKRRRMSKSGGVADSSGALGTSLY